MVETKLGIREEALVVRSEVYSRPYSVFSQFATFSNFARNQKLMLFGKGILLKQDRPILGVSALARVYNVRPTVTAIFSCRPSAARKFLCNISAVARKGGGFKLV